MAVKGTNKPVTIKPKTRNVKKSKTNAQVQTTNDNADLQYYGVMYQTVDDFGKLSQDGRLIPQRLEPLLPAQLTSQLQAR